MDLRGSDETIDGVGSAVRRRFSSSAQSPNEFLTPTFNSAVAVGGSISRIPLHIEPSLPHFPQSRLGRLHFSSSSSSSNESPDSNSTSTAAARKRIQQLVNLRSLSSLSHCGSTQSLPSPATNLQLFSRSSPPYSIYKSPVNVELEEDVLVMDALGESEPITFRARKPLEPLSSSSSSSAKSSHFGVNFFKTEICRSWDEFGLCRFGTRCQFAHGKEELRCTAGRSKLKQESGKQLSAVGSGGNYIKYPRYVPMLLMDSALPSSEAPSSSSSSSSQGIPMKTYAENLKIIAPVAQPSDPTFSWPPTEAQEAEIQLVLYGPSRRRNRLPVFQDVCPDSDEI